MHSHRQQNQIIFIIISRLSIKISNQRSKYFVHQSCRSHQHPNPSRFHLYHLKKKIQFIFLIEFVVRFHSYNVFCTALIIISYRSSIFRSHQSTFKRNKTLTLINIPRYINWHLYPVNIFTWYINWGTLSGKNSTIVCILAVLKTSDTVKTCPNMGKLNAQFFQSNS